MPHPHALPALHVIIWSLIFTAKILQKVINAEDILLLLDDPPENTQLQKAQQTLKSPANTQRDKAAMRI